jgi:hypothetical protein
MRLSAAYINISQLYTARFFVCYIPVGYNKGLLYLLPRVK